EVCADVAQHLREERVGVENLSTVSVEDEDAVLGGFKEPAVSNFRKAHRLCRAALLGNIFDGQQEELRLAAVAMDTPSVQQHGSATDVFKLLIHFKVVEGTVSGQNLFPQLA